MEAHLTPKSQQDTGDTELAESILLQEDNNSADMVLSEHTVDVAKSDPTHTYLHNLVVTRHHQVLRYMHELKVEVDEQKVAQSWFSKQRVSELVKITGNTSETVQQICNMLKDQNISAGILVGKLRMEGKIYTTVSTGNDLEPHDAKLPESQIFMKSNGTVSVAFEDFNDKISGMLNKEGFLEHAIMVTESETVSGGVFVGHNMIVTTKIATEKPVFKGYIHNVAEQQIAVFPEPWQLDAASTLRHFENKFFTSKFQLIFELSGFLKVATSTKTFQEVDDVSAVNKPYGVHKILFESSEPVGPMLKANGRFKILMYDEDWDGETPADDGSSFEDLDKISALCTRTGKELYFEHCSMGDWKISYVCPDTKLLAKNLTLLNN